MNITRILLGYLLSSASATSFCQTNNCGFKVSQKSKIEFLNNVTVLAIDGSYKDSSNIITIPVVFHVIYDDERENISDSNIIKELANLNEDFQLLNADVTNTPAEQRPLVGNPNIKFRIADVDPNGNHSSGIIRKRADRNVYTFRRPIFLADQMWNPGKYLNVYIGNIRNGRTRGYVNSYPWNNPSTDAIGLHYYDVGQSTRLLTHETGHWLGLWHIIEGGCSEINDGIEDTPRQSSFTNGCPVAKNECNNACMFRNYMDYSSCRVAFTRGQAERMRAVILKYRPLLIANP